MTIMPVSAVRFSTSGSNSTSFEGRKNRENREICEGGRCSSMPLKSIPLAAVIAMSPMANVNTVYADEPMEPRIEMIAPLEPTGKVSGYIPKPTWNLMGSWSYKNEDNGSTVTFNFYDTKRNCVDFDKVEIIKKRTNLYGEESVIDRMLVTNVIVCDDGSIKCAGVHLGPDLNNFAPVENPMYYYISDTRELTEAEEQDLDFDSFGPVYNEKFGKYISTIYNSEHNLHSFNIYAEDAFDCETTYKKDLNKYKELLRTTR
ncbi:hypothetical protein J6E39_00680 [bacterium]|nr:hypothetical protein [bacterium]